MDCFIKTLIAAVLMLICGLQTAEAQSDIDTNRMNRDINIMENVLEEMLKTSWAADGMKVRIQSGIFPAGQSRDINGTFLPDYGIIFNITGGPPGFIVSTDSNEENFSFHFEYGDDSNGEEVTEETITHKIVEFLRDYASTIRQLDDNHKVMVIYRANKPNPHVAVFSSSKENEEAKRQQLPTISVVATKADLQEYRTSSIGDDEFSNRLEINAVPTDVTPQKDMRVMASILETAFDGSDKETFRIRGSVDYVQLDNFGALFNFETRYAGKNNFALSGVHETLEALRKELKTKYKELEEKREAVDSLRLKKRKEVTEKNEQQKEQVLKSYDQFIADLKEHIVDYGRTLSSIDSNQRILVSISLSSRYDEIPERIDLQIQKSVLESMDQGSMNRNQAMEQIQVLEY